MNVKAEEQVTLTVVNEVSAQCRYYLLLSSDLEEPAKPTACPPEGWTATEPAYNGDDATTLYFVDCTVFSDETFSYSDVSVSSTYEVAKVAAKTASDYLEYTEEGLAVGNMYEQTFEKVSDGVNETTVEAVAGDVIRILPPAVHTSVSYTWFEKIINEDGTTGFTGHQAVFFPVYAGMETPVWKEIVVEGTCEYIFPADFEVYFMKTPLNKNVLIHSEGIDIRQYKTVLASFRDKLIEIGKTAADAVIKFCAGKATMGINSEDEFEISSDQIRMKSSADNGNASTIASSSVENDAFLVESNVGGMAVETGENSAHSYAIMEATCEIYEAEGVEAASTKAEIVLTAKNDGSQIKILADEVLVNGVNIVGSINDVAVRINNTAQLNPETAIPSDANLNDYHDIGSYRCNNATIAASLLNTPYTYGGFILHVSRPTGGSASAYRRQDLITSAGASRVFSRTYNASAETWNDWQEFAKMSDLESYAKTSDLGTLTTDFNEQLTKTKNGLSGVDADIMAEVSDLEKKFGTTVTDLNKATANGFYTYASSASNKPDSSGGTLIVSAYSSSYLTQLAFPNSSDNSKSIFKRTYGSSGWTAWKAV